MANDLAYTVMDDAANGLVLAGQYLPKEMVTLILAEVDVDTLLACRLVCSRWREVVDNVVWKEKVWRDRRSNDRLKSLASFKKGDIDKPEQFLTHLLYAVFKSDPFNRNHIRNSSGSDGGDAHWQMAIAKGWRAGKYNSEYCFRTLRNFRGFSVKEQVIKLSAVGLNSFTMDNTRPQFVITDEYRAKGYNLYCLQVSLFNYEDKLVCSKFVYRRTEELEFKKVEFAIFGYNAGVRNICILHICRGLNVFVRNTSLKINLKPYRVDPSSGVLDGYLYNDLWHIRNPFAVPHITLYATYHNELALTRDPEHPLMLRYQFYRIYQLKVFGGRIFYEMERYIPLPYPDGSWGPDENR